MRLILVLLALALLLGSAVTISHAEESAETGIMITEFFPDPTGSDLSAEFVEIMNAGDAEVNIGGWYITDQDGSVDFTFPNITMRPGDIAVIYVGNSTFRWSGGKEFFMNRSTSMLNNGGDDISVFDVEDRLIDYVSYGNGSMVDDPAEGEWEGAPLPEEGLSISRGSDGRWILTMPTPGLENPEDCRGEPVISALYPVARYSDEFFAIRNDGTESADISGYMLTDGEGRIYIPPNTILSPGEEIYITQNASGFLSEMGFMPDMEYSDCYTPSYFPQLSNDGDTLELQTPSGSNISFIAYGTPSPGKGHYLHLENGEWVDRRAGWIHTEPVRISFSGNVIPYSSPENSLDVISGLIDSADRSIVLNTYSFEDRDIAAHLISAVSRGVSVSILVEGNPVSGMDGTERYVLDALSAAGADIRLKNGTDRYRYDHAKYMVIDGNWALVQSENLNPDALSENGTWGNRGWGMAVESPELSAELERIFEHDSDLNFSDVERYVPESDSEIDALCGADVPESEYVEGNISLLAGPENGIDEVISAIGSARDSVYVEQFYIKREWAGQDSPLVNALISAARRGCEVRVLLDDEFYNLQDEDDNDEMAAYLNTIAEKEGLDMEARVIDSRMHSLVKVHNKGMIIDGRTVLISSFNWGMNSFTYNREMALLVENSSVASYYLELFTKDWKSDFSMPVAIIDGPSTAVYGEKIFLTSNSTDNGGIAETEWYLDGNPVSGNESMEISFNSTGVHVICLNVSDFEGNWNTTCLKITVIDRTLILPEVMGGDGMLRPHGDAHTADSLPTHDSYETDTRDTPSSSAIYYILLLPAVAVLWAAARISRGHS